MEDIDTSVSLQEASELEKELACAMEDRDTSVSLQEASELEKELACAMEDIESLKRELKTSVSRQEASELEKEEMRKELARAMGDIETLKRELNTSVSLQETSELEKEEMGKELALALDNIEVLRKELKAVTSRGAAMEMNITRLEGKLASAEDELAKGSRSTDSTGSPLSATTNINSARIRQLEQLLQLRQNTISDLEKQKEQAYRDLSRKDEVIKSLTMKLHAQKHFISDETPTDAAVVQDVVKGNSPVLLGKSTTKEEAKRKPWDTEDWEENTTEVEQGMTEDLCREVCSILYQLRRGSLKRYLSKILALPLTSRNIEGFAYIIHEMATNYPDLSEGFAKLSDAMFRKLPPEVGDKMRTFLLKQCRNLLMRPNVDPDNQKIIRTLDSATSAGEKRTLQVIYKDQAKLREKYINNTKFLGELWKAGSIETAEIRTIILKLLHDRNELSVKSLYSLLKAIGEHLEGSNEDLSQYFYAIEDMCKTADNISTVVKMDLEDLVELRRNQWNGEIY
jgi:hypothetical protein